MRGEYGDDHASEACHTELPPRARRILASAATFLLEKGTTSACAENTGLWPPPCCYSWNYLRVRGEYHVPRFVQILNAELPPRARRIPQTKHQTFTGTRTTSACAENTSHCEPIRSTMGNYLRVRGEYISRKASLTLSAELPPRARRIPTPC